MDVIVRDIFNLLNKFSEIVITELAFIKMKIMKLEKADCANTKRIQKLVKQNDPDGIRERK